jgi:hypothetical protein
LLVVVELAALVVVLEDYFITAQKLQKHPMGRHLV